MKKKLPIEPYSSASSLQKEGWLCLAGPYVLLKDKAKQRFAGGDEWMLLRVMADLDAGSKKYRIVPTNSRNAQSVNIWVVDPDNEGREVFRDGVQWVKERYDNQKEAV